MDGEGRWGLAVEGIRPVLVILRCLAGLQEGQFQECIQSRKWGQFPGCVSALFREGRELCVCHVSLVQPVECWSIDLKDPKVSSLQIESH